MQKRIPSPPIPGRRFDHAALSRRHREIADEWRGRGYLSDVPTVTAHAAPSPWLITGGYALGIILGTVILALVFVVRQ